MDKLEKEIRRKFGLKACLVETPVGDKTTAFSTKQLADYVKRKMKQAWAMRGAYNESVGVDKFNKYFYKRIYGSTKKPKK
jgi:hypothetical protein